MNIKLNLSEIERKRLRSAGIKKRDIHTLNPATLAEILSCSEDHANTLIGLATFQQIPSIGYRMAENLVHNLGKYSLDDVRNEDPAKLFDLLEVKVNQRIDPCVEDQIRCIVYYANNLDSEKQWFDFTEERKIYREKQGYPETRPAL